MVSRVPFAINATFHLGFYQAHTPMGELERYPSPARLYSAIVAAAWQLARLSADDPSSALLDEADERVFEWLEHNPPDAFRLPDLIANESPAITYRDCGEVAKAGLKGRNARPAVESVAFGGPVSWYWNQPPSEDVRCRIDVLLGEITYLGEAVSSVCLTATPVEQIPADAYVRTEPSFDAESVLTPLAGRYEELQNYYESQVEAKAGKDGRQQEQLECPTPVPSACLGAAYYAQVTGEGASLDAGESPWPIGYRFVVEGKRLFPEDRKDWATCMHRAIARRIGEDALPRIMQRFRPGDVPDELLPANGLAIQIISADLPVSEEYASEEDMILIMIPAGASAHDRRAIVGALYGIESLYSRRLGRVDVRFEPEEIDLTRFWEPVSPQTIRCFETEPLFIANHRPPCRPKRDGSRWTVEDDVRVAIGYVWRTAFGPVTRGDAGRVGLSVSVASAGVTVSGARVVPTPNIDRYVHKSNKGSMLVGMRAIVGLGSLKGERQVAAIGQTRHLGGGLLVPLDIPVPVSVLEASSQVVPQVSGAEHE